jgi:hypothetical protein
VRHHLSQYITWVSARLWNAYISNDDDDGDDSTVVWGMIMNEKTGVHLSHSV